MTAPAPRRWRPWQIVVVASLPACFAVWLHLPLWSGGLLQDDLALLGYLVEPGGSAMRWSRVAEDFCGAWAFGNLNYYRPLVTLSFALELWLGGGAPAVFHGSCIVTFALLVWASGVLFGLLGGRLAALAGGLVLAAHPAATEPIGWVCTRADFLYLLAGAVACVLFVRHLRGRTGQLRGVVAASVCALLSKEPAVLLPVWFVLLDLAERGFAVRWSSRLWLHLRLAPLWLGYFAFRRLVLGVTVGDPFGAARGSVGDWITIQGHNLLACCAPMGSHVPAVATIAGGAFTVWLAVALRWPAARRGIALGAAWTFVGLLPAQWLSVLDGLSGYRIVLAASVGFALAGGLALGADGIPRRFRGLGLVLLGGAVAGLASATRSIQRVYLDAYAHMDRLCEQIDPVGRRATVERPLVLLFARHESVVHFLWPMMTFPIVETPVASADHPFVSLASTFGGEGGRWMLVRDPGPWRALWQHGAVLCYWGSEVTGGQLRTVPSPRETPPLELVPDGNGAFVVRGGTAGPWPIAGLTVVADAPFAGGELAWFGPAGDGGRLAIGAGERTAAGWSARVDVGADFDFLVEATIAGLAGFRATLTAPAPAAVVAMHVLPPPAPAPLPALLRDTTVSLPELGQRLAHVLPPDADAGSASVVVMTGYCPLRFDLVDGLLTTPLGHEVILGELRRWIHVDRCYYYLEYRRQGRPWRSAIDWFVLDTASRG